MKNQRIHTVLLVGVSALAMLLLISSFSHEFEVNGGGLVVGGLGRKLKEEGYDAGAEKGTDDGDIGMQDYRPFDPVPSSKTSVKSGPINHGTPVIPYLPDPTAPSPPEQGS